MSGYNLKTSDRPAGDSEYVYGWGYTADRGFYASIKKVGEFAIRSALATLSFGLSEVAIYVGKKILKFIERVFGGKSKSSIAAATLKAGMDAAWSKRGKDEITPNAMPKTVDAKRGRRNYKAGLKKSVAYKRWFLGPKFFNKAQDPNNQCEVMGRAAACFRSAYVVPFNEVQELNGDSLATINTANQAVETYQSYLMDPTQPMFVPDNIISLNGMPGDGRPWNIMVNAASKKGVEYLKSIRPRRHLRKWGGYGKTSRSHGNTDIVGAAMSQGYFFPGNNDQGDYVPVLFGDRKNTVINAARKYALCTNLFDCGAPTMTNGELGFGHLFESRQEAQDFAEYTYKVHYVWSHLSKESYMGYPAAGLDQYFQMVAYNMKLAGSLAASRSVQALEAADLYQTDWETRVGEYSSLGKATAGVLSKSRKYSANFIKAFKTTIGSSATSIAGSKAQLSKIIDGGNFSSAELTALNAASGNALRRNQDAAKRATFDKALFKASDATKKLVSDNVEALGRKNAPLESFSVAKLGGGGRGFKKLSNAINNLNSSIKKFNNKNAKSSRSQNYGSTFTLPKRANYNPSSSGSSYNQPLPPPIQSNKDTGFTSNQVNSLLKNLSKEDLKTNGADTLFNVVSKAYKRNYSRVLRRSKKKVSADDLGGDDKEEKDLSNERKEKIRNLLKD